MGCPGPWAVDAWPGFELPATGTLWSGLVSSRGCLDALASSLGRLLLCSPSLPRVGFPGWGGRLRGSGVLAGWGYCFWCCHHDRWQGRGHLAAEPQGAQARGWWGSSVPGLEQGTGSLPFPFTGAVMDRLLCLCPLLGGLARQSQHSDPPALQGLQSHRVCQPRDL